MASGKTTTAKLLGKRYPSSKVLLENTDIHPFLSDFYGNSREYAFETEVNFALLHYHQLKKADQNALFRSDVFADFLFDKDMIFAGVTLKNNKREYGLFSRLFSYCKERIRKPDIVVFLRAPTDLILDRIRKRGREFEKNMEFAYVDAINNAYNRFFLSYRDTRLKIIDVTQIDRLSEDELARVIDAVRKTD